MSRFAFITALSLVVFALPAFPEPVERPRDERVTTARSMVEEFSGSLRSALQAAIQEGGLINGIEVCNTAAPEIAASLNSSSWTISRTSLKVRNPDNAPTSWQETQLAAMEQQPLTDGKPTEIWQTSEIPGEPAFQYMSAIPTGPLCLGCHGKSIAPGVKAKLAELYPDDQATGFSAGDLRGAFVVLSL